MTELFAADLHRILWRPFTRALGIVVVTAIAIASITVFVKSGGKHPFETLPALPAGFGRGRTMRSSRQGCCSPPFSPCTYSRAGC